MNYRCASKNTGCRDRPAAFSSAWFDSRTTRNRAHKIRRPGTPFALQRAPCPRDLFSIHRGRNRVRGRLELILRLEPRGPTATLGKKPERNVAKASLESYPNPHVKQDPRKSSITTEHGLCIASRDNAPHDDIQNRNENQVQRGRGNHSAKDGGAHRHSPRSACALREYQWHYAQNKRERSHQYGPQTDARRFHRSLDH